ncbi:MAG: hypothetical protein HY566_03585 [Candidatus Kerfeldbacteria bacterium]|nr:hypothetical protein [Candidatus Kerfeldbacteria bacterium]
MRFEYEICFIDKELMTCTFNDKRIDQYIVCRSIAHVADFKDMTRHDVICLSKIKIHNWSLCKIILSDQLLLHVPGVVGVLPQQPQGKQAHSSTGDYELIIVRVQEEQHCNKQQCANEKQNQLAKRLEHKLVEGVLLFSTTWCALQRVNPIGVAIGPESSSGEPEIKAPSSPERPDIPRQNE